MKVKMEGLTWSFDIPQEAGCYLFYGYLYKPLGENGYFERKGSLKLIHATKTSANALQPFHTFYSGDGQILYPNSPSSQMIGLWAEIKADFSNLEEAINDRLIDNGIY